MILNIKIELNDDEINFLKYIKNYQINNTFKIDTFGWKKFNLVEDLINKNILNRNENNMYNLTYIGKLIKEKL